MKFITLRALSMILLFVPSYAQTNRLTFDTSKREKRSTITWDSNTGLAMISYLGAGAAIK